MADLDRLDIAAGIDTSGLDAGLQQQLRLIDRFADSLAQANRTFPPITIGLDSSAVDRGLAETRAKFDRVIKETRDLAKFPDLTTEAQQREISELAKEYTGLDTAIRRIDPTGILGGVAGQARAAAQAIEAVIAKRQQAEAPLKLAVDTAGLTAQMEGAVLAVKGSTEQIHALLQQTFLDEAKIGQVVPGAAPAGVASQQNPEAARLAQAVADEAAASARAAEAMDRLTAADAQQALAAAQAGAASQEAARQIEAQGRAALLAAEQQAQAQRLASAGGLAGPGGIGPITPPAGLRELIAQEEALRLVTRGIPAEVSRTSAAFNEAGRQASVLSREIRDVVSGSEKMAAGIDLASGGVTRLGRAHDGLLESGEHGARALRSVAQAAAVLGAEAIGVSGPLTRIAEGLIVFTGGVGPLLAVGVAVGALGVIWEKVTANIREGQKATEDFIDAQVKAARARDPIGGVQESFQGIDELGRHVEGITPRVRRLNEELAEVRKGVDIPTEAGTIVHFVDEGAIAKLKQQIEDAKTAAKETGVSFVQPILQAAQAATRQGIQDDLSLQQGGIQARQQALQAGFAQELVTRDQFFQQTRALNAAAAEADVAGLRRQLQAASAVPPGGETPAEAAAREATITHLRAEIQIRQQLLALTQAQSQAAETAARTAVIERGLPSTITPPVLAETTTTVPLRAASLGIAELTARFEAMNREAARSDLENEFERARVAALALGNKLDEVHLKLKDIGNAEISAPPQKLLDTISQAVTAAGDLAVALGGVGEQGQQAFSAVSNLFQAAASGNLFGAISVVASLGGPDAAEREHIAAVKENSERLKALSSDIQLLNPKFQASAGIGLGSRETRGLVAGGVENEIIQREAAGASDKEITRRVNEEAQRFGLSLKELNDIAKANDLGKILDDKGHIIAGSLTQLDEAFRLAEQKIVAFGATLDEQLTLDEIRSRVEGKGQTPADKFAREEAAFAGRSPVIAQAFQGVDTGNEAQVRAATKSLLDQAAAGTLTAETLGVSHDEFVKFLGDSADFLDSFNKSLQDATKTLSNVPDLSTLAEQEFRARSAFSTGQGPNDGAQLPIIRSGGIRGTDINPPIPAPGISESRVTLDGEKVADPVTAALSKVGGGASLKDILDALTGAGATPSQPAPTSAQGRLQQFFGPINLTVEGAKDPDATVEAFRAKLAGIRLAETGQEDAP